MVAETSLVASNSALALDTQPGIVEIPHYSKVASLESSCSVTKEVSIHFNKNRKLAKAQYKKKS